MPVAFRHAITGYTVLAPRGSLGKAVLKHRLEPVYGRGECGFRGEFGLEFVPKSPELVGLVRGQQTENAVGRKGFAFVLVAMRAVS